MEMCVIPKECLEHLIKAAKAKHGFLENLQKTFFGNPETWEPEKKELEGCIEVAERALNNVTVAK